MAAVTCSTHEAVQTAIADLGYAFVHGSSMRDLLATYGSLPDWDLMADSWNRLELDMYMADGGRYRRRRHATFRAAREGAIVRTAHQPHFQSLDYNPLNGGVARWFEPIEPAIGDSASLTTVLAFARGLFSALSPTTPAWVIEIHQFRIEARLGEEGRPTPEGLHRDGVDYVLVLLVERRNIESGVTTIYSLDGHPLGDFTLTAPFDAALVDDTRVAHGVTPVEPLDPSAPAHRDVLIVTFKGQKQYGQ